MSDQSTTLEHFIYSSTKTVQATRAYLLDKPCARCHRSTNIRVNLPTCSHRICSACLAGFESSQGSLGPIVCPACSAYWFTLPSVPKIEKRGKEIGHQTPGNAEAEKSMPTWTIDNLWLPQNSTLSNEASALPKSFTHDSLDNSDVSFTGTVGEVGSEDLDFEILRVQEQWKTFCAGQDGTIADAQSQQLRNGHYHPVPPVQSQPEINQNKEIKEECVFELEATEIRTNKSSMAEMASQNLEQPPIRDQEVVTDTSQIEESLSTIALAADKQAIKPIYSLAILLIMVYIVFEFVSGLVLAASSVLSMHKNTLGV
ncbi:hypothetical protein P171DRAFT_489123 [Karstenula rhodostoma CBS 690.94]|uniref:RING-type domain-containing protein n=1 Tax=Karstenula rhodostoma CBS 690.94 TaxID=1392251 RepID=A0A9P4U8P8_9PLEO|nr:hypothetical protein P171DRAFT_489123 [Karstenula rhodostoma CBS 690.94]